MISCLILRVAVNLQFNESIGPLIKIVAKMGQDFLNFFVLYSLLTVMFAIVGNMNYILYMQQFNGFFTSILTVIDASLGTFNFKIFE